MGLTVPVDILRLKQPVIVALVLVGEQHTTGNFFKT